MYNKQILNTCRLREKTRRHSRQRERATTPFMHSALPLRTLARAQSLELCAARRCGIFRVPINLTIKAKRTYTENNSTTRRNVISPKAEYHYTFPSGSPSSFSFNSSASCFSDLHRTVQERKRERDGARGIPAFQLPEPILL